MGVYQAWDAITTSKMERMRNEYQNALNELESYMTTINSAMNWVPDACDQLIRSFQGGYGGDPSQGGFVREFEQRTSVVEKELKSLYSYSGTLASKAAVLRSKKTEVERRLAILKGLCIREDREEKELPLSAIPF